MENNQVENILNERTGNKFGFKLKSAKLIKSTGLCYIELFYKDGTILSPLDRKEAEDIVLSFLPKNFNYDIKFVKNFVVDEAVSDFITNFFKHNYPSVLYEIKKVDCENNVKEVNIAINEKIYDYVISKDIKKDLEKKLEENFSAKIQVSFSMQESNEITLVETEIVEDYFEIEKPEERFIEVTNVEPLIGEFKDTLAHYIKDKTSPQEDVVLCGKITFIKEYSYKVKLKKKEAEKTEDAEEENAESAESERKYFKFSIEDFTGKINCVFFANKMNLEIVQKLEAQNTVILFGRLEPDKFSGGVSMRVKQISRCELPSTFEEKINYKSEPASYKYVYPEPVEFYAQSDLFAVENKKVNEFLLNNDLVVFDFETTGLKLDGTDKIIEIGAVKVVKGKIVERFMCFVNPEMHIPDKSTLIHGITDEDVKDAPTFWQVMPDFYKFTRNCYLSGYNIIGFDMIFLNHFGKLSGYNFDNKTVDVFNVARQIVKGAKNYKLKTIADKLGVVLDNAHRAVYDTIATAEVLIKLSEDNEIKPD